MRRRRLKRIRERIRRGRPMMVCAYRVLNRGFTYAVCPHCGETMEREYVPYCALCGQHLNWRSYPSLFTGETP